MFAFLDVPRPVAWDVWFSNGSFFPRLRPVLTSTSCRVFFGPPSRDSWWTYALLSSVSFFAFFPHVHSRKPCKSPPSPFRLSCFLKRNRPSRSISGRFFLPTFLRINRLHSCFSLSSVELDRRPFAASSFPFWFFLFIEIAELTIECETPRAPFSPLSCGPLLLLLKVSPLAVRGVVFRGSDHLRIQGPYGVTLGLARVLCVIW